MGVPEWVRVNNSLSSIESIYFSFIILSSAIVDAVQIGSSAQVDQR